MTVFCLVVCIVCIISCAVTYLMLMFRMEQLSDDVDRLETQIINTADYVSKFEARFSEYMQGEAKDIAEALEKSQKMEQDFYDGFQNIISYSADVAYGRKKSE